MLAAKSKSFRNQQGIGNVNSNEDSNWKSCHDVELQAFARFSSETEDAVEAAELVKTCGNMTN